MENMKRIKIFIRSDSLRWVLKFNGCSPRPKTLSERAKMTHEPKRSQRKIIFKLNNGK